MIAKIKELPYKVAQPIDLDLEDTSWEKCGIDNVRHTARAIIIDSDKLLFVHVSRRDAFGNIEYIETSGGGVKKGEDLLTALRRELKEELGIEVSILAYLGQVRDFYNLIHRQNINDYFLVKTVGHGLNNLTADEKNRWHLKPVRLSLTAARKHYDKMSTARLGFLISQRERPILVKAQEIMQDNQFLVK